MQPEQLAPEQADTQLRDYPGIFLRHRWLLVCCLIAGLLAGMYWGSSQLTEYRAIAVIQAEKKKSEFSPGMAQAGGAEAAFASDLWVLKSRAFLERVARRLNHEFEVLPANPPLVESLTRLKSRFLGSRDLPWVAANRTAPVTFHEVKVGQDARGGIYTLAFTDEQAFVVSPEGNTIQASGTLGHRFEGWGFGFLVDGGPTEAGMRLAFRVRGPQEVVGGLRDAFSVSVVSGTNFLEVGGKSGDPERARGLVEAVVAEYMEFSPLQREQEMSQSLRYIDRQLGVVQSNFDEKLSEVRDFKERNPLAALAENSKELIGQSTSYEVQLRKLEETMTAARTLRTALTAGNSAATGSLLWIEAAQLGETRVLTMVENLLEAEEEKLALSANFSIPDPRTRLVELKAERTRKRLVEYIAILLTLYEKQADFLRKVVKEFDEKLQQLPELEQGLARITRRVRVNQDMYSYLIQRREEIQIARAIEAGSSISVIDPAYVTAISPTPKKMQKALLGLVLGLAGGFGLALLREQLDPSLKSVEEVERFLGLPVFGAIPEFQVGDGAQDAPEVDRCLVVLHQPRSSAAEAYRTLRTNIQFAEPDKHVKTLVLTSAIAAEGKTVSSANLAVAISQLGQRTLLVDADLRRPTIHQIFHVPQEPGLSDVLVGAVSWREAVKATPVENLFVLSSGKSPPNPSELLGSARMSQLMEEWGREYDRVLFDCSPVLAVTDPAMLASKCDKTLLVVRANRTAREAAQRALGMLGTVHAAMMGIVLNGIKVERGYYGSRYGSSYDYYHRDYHGYYGDEPRPRRRPFWGRRRRGEG